MSAAPHLFVPLLSKHAHALMHTHKHTHAHTHTHTQHMQEQAFSACFVEAPHLRSSKKEYIDLFSALEAAQRLRNQVSLHEGTSFSQKDQRCVCAYLCVSKCYVVQRDRFPAEGSEVCVFCVCISMRCVGSEVCVCVCMSVCCVA